jgi:hypothetical protein
MSESANGRISESVALDPFSSLGGEQSLMVTVLKMRLHVGTFER